MLSVAAKKRKVLTETDLVGMSLKEAVKLTKKSLLIHDTWSDWLTHAASNGKLEVFNIFSSSYFHDVTGINLFVAPPYMQRLETKRDAQKRIISIKDDKSKLTGMSLGKMMFISWAASEGYDEVVFRDDSDGVSALLFGRTKQLIETSLLESDENATGYEMFTPLAKTHISVSGRSLLEVLKLPYIGIADAKSIAIKLNKLTHKEGLRSDIKDLESLSGLQKNLKDSERRLDCELFEALIGACVSKTTFEQRVSALATQPSSQFARTLRLPKAYSGPLFNRGDLKSADKVKLASLADDDEVLVSTTFIDAKYYESIRSDPGEFPVYKATANIGIMKNKKWEPLTVVGTVKAKDFLAMLTCISAANSGAKVAPTSTSHSNESDEDLEDLDI